MAAEVSFKQTSKPVIAASKVLVPTGSSDEQAGWPLSAPSLTYHLRYRHASRHLFIKIIFIYNINIYAAISFEVGSAVLIY